MLSLLLVCFNYQIFGYASTYIFSFFPDPLSAVHDGILCDAFPQQIRRVQEHITLKLLVHAVSSFTTFSFYLVSSLGSHSILAVFQVTEA